MCNRINRNIVECKYEVLPKDLPAPSFELIETLWNVNVLLSQALLLQVLELIETLWNVNLKKELSLLKEDL